MMNHPFRILITLGFAAALLGSAGDAFAQSPADAKRTLKAWRAFYIEPGMIEVDPRYMRGILMLTGFVATEEHIQKADEIGNGLKGVKEVRNRLRVREPEVASGGEAELEAKLNKHIDDDEDLSKAKAKGKLEFTVDEEGNVVLKGKLQDYTEASQLVNDFRRTVGVRTILFKKLKY